MAMLDALRALESLGTVLPTWVAWISLWTAGLLVGAVLADRLLRRHVRPAWRIALYAAVFLRVALPTDWASPLSLVPDTPSPVLAADQGPALIEPEPPVLLSVGRDYTTSAETPALAPTQQASMSADTPNLDPWAVLLGCAYLIGVLVVLGRHGLGVRALRDRLKDADPARPAVARLAPDIPVFERQGLGPLAFGILRRVVVVPSHAMETLAPRELACVVEHEVAHLRRHDPLLVLVLTIICALAWPLLPVWIAARRVRRLVEMAADELVLRKGAPDTALLYGQAILRMAALRTEPMEPVPSSLRLGGYAELSDRVAALGTRPSLAGALQSAIAIAVTAGFLACAGLAEDRAELERRAADLAEQGDYAGSTEIYERLLDRYPEDPMGCEWQFHVAENSGAMDDPPAHWRAVQDLATKYEALLAEERVSKTCRNLTVDTFKSFATTYHDRAEKLREPGVHQIAEAGYREFLRLFPDDADAYELHYYLGEIMWARAVNLYNEGSEAAKDEARQVFHDTHEEFVRVLERDPEGKYVKDATYAQMVAMKNHMGVEYRLDRPERKGESGDGVPGTVAEKYPRAEYDAATRELVASYERFLGNFDPSDKEYSKVSFARAKLAMEHNRFDEAMPLLEDILARFDGTIESVWASEMLLDALTIRWLDERNTPEQRAQGGDDTERWAKKVQGMKLWEHEEASKVREHVPALLAHVQWIRAMDEMRRAKAGDPTGYERCAERFMALYEEFWRHPKAPHALYRAGECYRAAGKTREAVAARKVLLVHPLSEVGGLAGHALKEIN
jgi:TolA-binding protein/Zn-dependent protease with chaperone function